MHHALCTLHHAPCTIHFALCTMRFALCTCTMHMYHMPPCTFASWILHLDTAHGTRHTAHGTHTHTHTHTHAHSSLHMTRVGVGGCFLWCICCKSAFFSPLGMRSACSECCFAIPVPSSLKWYVQYSHARQILFTVYNCQLAHGPTVNCTSNSFDDMSSTDQSYSGIYESNETLLKQPGFVVHPNHWNCTYDMYKHIHGAIWSKPCLTTEKSSSNSRACKYTIMQRAVA